jgi:hypothetical protein
MIAISSPVMRRDSLVPIIFYYAVLTELCKFKKDIS